MKVLNDKNQWVGDGQIVDRDCECIHHRRLGPPPFYPYRSQEEADKARDEFIDSLVRKIKEGTKMHYRNGREAKNGDKIVKLEGGKVTAYGVLHSATPGNDYCNGYIATIQQPNGYACMVDCLHVEDVAEILSEKGLDKRPEGK